MRVLENIPARLDVEDVKRQLRLNAKAGPSADVGELVELIANTPSEGGTNLEEALQLGMEKAKEDFLAGAQNRVILLIHVRRPLRGLGKWVEGVFFQLIRISPFVQRARRNLETD